MRGFVGYLNLLDFHRIHSSVEITDGKGGNYLKAITLSNRFCFFKSKQQTFIKSFSFIYTIFIVSYNNRQPMNL